MTGESFDFGMTELEERLRGPSGRQVAENALARLDALSAELLTQLEGGVPTAQRAEFNVVLNSLAAAKQVMLSVIQQMQRVTVGET